MTDAQKLDAAIRLAKEATNGWGCYAKRQIEHDEIARLHRDIASIEALPASASPHPENSDGLRAQITRLAEAWLEAGKGWENDPAGRTVLRHGQVLRDTLKRTALPASASPHPETGDLKLMAGVMKKLLPPKLLAEVLTYLDPLGTFEAVLRETSSEPREELTRRDVEDAVGFLSRPDRGRVLERLGYSDSELEAYHAQR